MHQSTQARTIHPEGLPPLQRHAALAAVACAMALSVLSTTSVSVALPVIARDLGLDPAGAVSLVTLFQLALVATLFPFAAAGELWGFRKTFLGGVSAVAVASLICAFTRDLEVLLAGRILQGLGASAVMAVNPALLRLSVPRAQLGRAIGWNAMLVGIATALGPSLAAVVLSWASWPWLFLLNVPWALLALSIGVRVLPQQAPAATRRFDGVGAALSVLTFVFLSMALQSVATRGWRAAALLLAGIGVALALYRQQKARRLPLLPLDLLRLPLVRTAAGASVCAFLAQMTALVALPFLLHDSVGLDIFTTGMIMMAWPLCVALMAPVAGHIEGRGVSSVALCVCGGTVLGVGLIALAFLSGRGSPIVIGAAMALCGIGFGCFQTPNNRSMITATPRERSGAAGGLQATARLTGQMLGASVVATAYDLLADDPRTAGTCALAVAAAFALVSALCSLRRGRTP